MSSTRGPVPKRNANRAGHRAKADRADVAVVDFVVVPPALPREKFHAKARAWYRSLGRSGQSRWYEPSDWQHATIVARLMSDLLESGESNAAAWRVVFDEMGKLGTTENARRRMRIEVERPLAPTEAPLASDAVVTQLRRLADGS